MSVAIVGTGANLASLQFALERLGTESTVTLDGERIQVASHVILPGVVRRRLRWRNCARAGSIR